MVLHAGIGLVVVSTKSVPLQLKESPFTFFSTHLSRLVKILRQCAVGKTRKKPFASAVLPEFPNFISFSPKYVFHQGPLTPRGWQTNYSHIVLVFIKKHLTDYFISTLITNYTIVLFTQDFKYDSHKCVIASIFLLSVNTQKKIPAMN